MDTMNPYFFIASAGLLLSMISLLFFKVQGHKTPIPLPVLQQKLNGYFGSDRPAPPQKDQPSSPRSTFPPSMREHLNKGATARSTLLKRSLSNLTDSASLEQRVIPFDADYTKCSPETCTVTDISVSDIIALGDLPDYAAISDVPLPKPVSAAFDIAKALPRPYRPFRWKYHQHMALSKLEPDYWLELESTYTERIHQRVALHKQYGSHILQYLPGTELACKELMEHALQFYCARYPKYFKLSYQQTDERGWVFENGIMGTETVLKEVHPLFVLLHNVPEDFAVMIRNEKDGLYYLRAGVLCSTLGWTIESKIGKPLHEIHEPVPDYREKMAKSMDRYFSKLPPSTPIQRGSWSLELNSPLFVPPGHPDLLTRDTPCPPSTDLSSVHLRVDWQTLRRLPLSGSIIFNFKALFTPLTELRDEPGVPGLVGKVLREGKKELLEYKGTAHVDGLVSGVLEGWEREQVEKGLVDGEVRTLDLAPFFECWEEKWHRQQGF